MVSDCKSSTERRAGMGSGGGGGGGGGWGVEASVLDSKDKTVSRVMGGESGTENDIQ